MSAETPDPRAQSLRSTEDVARELDQERRARQRATAEAEEQGRNMQALDQLSSAALAAASVDELLQKLLEILIDVAGADVAVARLREGDRLRSRAAIGLEEEVAAGFSLPVDQALPGQDRPESGTVIVSSGETDGAGRSSFIREREVRALYCLPLVGADELVGVIYLGSRDQRDLSDPQRRLLGFLATRASAAVVRQTRYDALQQAIRARDEILGIVAHDLRNPVNVISLAANSLLNRLPNSSARRSVERIVRGAHRADRLIQGLLEIDAIEGGRFSVNARTVETADTILAALESQQSLAADASIIISTDLSPELPPIEADEERLLEVLENLVGNAIKFTTPGGSVTVGASAREDEVLFWVKDNGAGIATEDLPHLFDRFWQGRKKDRRGTGLGLTICKAIVEAHGGRIWPETKTGHGTTMYFTVPAVPRAPKTTSVKIANILLVDDRPENLLSLKAILERPGYRLLAARSGEEALSLALRETFAVALIDIAMPRMSGLDVAVHLKALERSRDIPIIFITAFGDDPEEIHRAYSAGGADYLVKPLDSEIVRKKVAVFVDLSRRREANGGVEPEKPSPKT